MGIERAGAAATTWTIHGERIGDDSRRLRLSIASVELPDGVRFEQYVLRMPKAAMVAVLDDADRVLLPGRHRWVIDRWVWELPGGYVDPDEEPAQTAAREVEEETGWRPRSIELLTRFSRWSAALMPSTCCSSPAARTIWERPRTSTRPSGSRGCRWTRSGSASPPVRSSAPGRR